MKSKSLFVLLGIVISLSSYAKVRTLYVNATQMRAVQLTMGKTTVLRFSEKPKKVVVGNQNYFNVEFIDNDLAIQPLGTVSTNLFVYGEFHTYGIILKVSNSSYYDDLVQVRWQGSQRVINVTSLSRPAKSKNILKSLLFNKIEITLKKISQGPRGLHFIDLEVKNLSKETIKTKDLEINLTRQNKPLKDQRAIIEKEQLGANDKSRIRVMVKLKAKKSFTLNAKLNESHQKIIIKGASL